jgi:hypothetical protein
MPPLSEAEEARVKAARERPVRDLSDPTFIITNPREVLINVLQTIKRQAQKYGDNPHNRMVTEVVDFRLNIAQKFESIAAIEEEIYCGDMEELISQAHSELSLLVHVNEEMASKPWEADEDGLREMKECYHPLFNDNEYHTAYSDQARAAAQAIYDKHYKPGTTPFVPNDSDSPIFQAAQKLPYVAGSQGPVPQTPASMAALSAGLKPAAAK